MYEEQTYDQVLNRPEEIRMDTREAIANRIRGLCQERGSPSTSSARFPPSRRQQSKASSTEKAKIRVQSQSKSYVTGWKSLWASSLAHRNLMHWNRKSNK